jgi:thioredoxin 1
MVAPEFEKMSNEYTNVIFVKVDVDSQQAIMNMCGVSCMPTFQYFKGGVKVDEVVGADVRTLRAKVQSLA